LVEPAGGVERGHPAAVAAELDGISLAAADAAGVDGTVETEGGERFADASAEPGAVDGLPDVHALTAITQIRNVVSVRLAVVPAMKDIACTWFPKPCARSSGRPRLQELG
jgi:hypothetical protein